MVSNKVRLYDTLFYPFTNAPGNVDLFTGMIGLRSFANPVAREK